MSVFDDSVFMVEVGISWSKELFLEIRNHAVRSHSVCRLYFREFIWKLFFFLGICEMLLVRERLALRYVK